MGAISNSDRPAHLTAVRDDGPEGPASAPAHDRSAGERHARRSRLAGLRAVPGYVWWVTALYVTVLVGYSIVVPTYRAPDEPLHVDLSHLFSEELTYPAWYERDTGPDVQRSLSIVRFGDQAAHLEAGDAPPKSERPAFEDLASPPMPTGINQLPQHPPLYYVTTGLAMWAAEAVVGDPIGDFVLETWLYRAMSIAFVAVLPLAVWRVCELLGAARTVTVTAMLVPLAIPQLMHIGASANNDNLVLAFMWLSTPVVLRIARGALGTRTAVLAGVLTGLGLLTKLYASVLPIWVLGALLLAVRRARRANLGAAVRFAVVYGVVALVTGGWWWIRNIVLYGELTPSRFSELVPPTDRPRDLWAFLDAWAYSTTRRFWGDFGWYDTHISGVVVAVDTAVCLLALAVGCARPDRVTGTPRSFRLLLVAPLLALIVGQFSLALRGYINTGRMAGLQGRYWFGAVAGLAVVVALGLANLVGRRQRWLPLGALAAVAGMQLAAMSTIFGFYWGEPGSALADRVRAVVAWAALPGELLGVGAVLGVVAVAGGLWSVVGSARLPRDPAPPRLDDVRAA